MSRSQTIQGAVLQWEGVSAAPHRFGGVEYVLTLGNRQVEIGHVHGNSLVDIPYTRKIRDALVDEGIVQPHHVLPDSGWISFYMRSDADAEVAINLLRLSYLHKQRSRSGDVAQELERLRFSEAVRSAVK